MSGIIDFHSHVLPGIDDGSATAEESISMLLAPVGNSINDVALCEIVHVKHPGIFLENFL